MDDLINRQAAIDAMNAKLEDIKLRWRGKVKKGEIAMYLDMRGTIETLPSAQPEIIRCKDCQYSEYDAMYGDRYCHYDGKAEVVPDGHFCGYGKERQYE